MTFNGFNVINWAVYDEVRGVKTSCRLHFILNSSFNGLFVLFEFSDRKLIPVYLRYHKDSSCGTFVARGHTLKIIIFLYEYVFKKSEKNSTSPISPPQRKNRQLFLSSRYDLSFPFIMGTFFIGLYIFSVMVIRT
jgi:hypothetical protein